MVPLAVPRCLEDAVHSETLRPCQAIDHRVSIKTDALPLNPCLPSPGGAPHQTGQGVYVTNVSRRLFTHSRYRHVEVDNPSKYLTHAMAGGRQNTLAKAACALSPVFSEAPRCWQNNAASFNIKL